MVRKNKTNKVRVSWRIDESIANVVKMVSKLFGLSESDLVRMWLTRQYVYEKRSITNTMEAMNNKIKCAENETQKPTKEDEKITDEEYEAWMKEMDTGIKW